MLILWVGAIMIVLAGLYLRPVLAPFGRQYFKGVENLPDGLSDLLGGQLTIIGIVFPLVVGLISVLFQKNRPANISSQPISFTQDTCLLV